MEKGQYNQEDIEFMCITDKSRNTSRIKELLNFIKLNNYQTVGIASCFSVYNFAIKLKETLEQGKPARSIEYSEEEQEIVFYSYIL